MFPKTHCEELLNDEQIEQQRFRSRIDIWTSVGTINIETVDKNIAMFPGQIKSPEVHHGEGTDSIQELNSSQPDAVKHDRSCYTASEDVLAEGSICGA